MPNAGPACLSRKTKAPFLPSWKYGGGKAVGTEDFRQLYRRLVESCGMDPETAMRLLRRILAILYAYDLVFLCTVRDLIVHADGSIAAGEVELTSRGTAETERALMDDIQTWYTDPTVESVGFAG